jgi:18S rRNA (guanine1575-N7)-methyltransferase
MSLCYFPVIRVEKRKGGQHKVAVKSKEWIVNKKATRRKQGKIVKEDSKYTGRKRHAAF